MPQPVQQQRVLRLKQLPQLLLQGGSEWIIGAAGLPASALKSRVLMQDAADKHRVQERAGGMVQTATRQLVWTRHSQVFQVSRICQQEIAAQVRQPNMSQHFTDGGTGDGRLTAQRAMRCRGVRHR